MKRDAKEPLLLRPTVSSALSSRFPSSADAVESYSRSFSARLALIVSHRRSGGFLAFRQRAVNEDVSKKVLSKGLVLDCRTPID